MAGTPTNDACPSDVCPQTASVWEIRGAWALRTLIGAALVVHIAQGEVLYVLLCAAGIALVVAPPLMARSSRLNVPIELELVLLWWLASDMLLGRAIDLYDLTGWYDKALHFGNSALAGYLGFLVVYALHVTGRLRTSARLDAALIVLVTLGIGAAWEIAEYVADLLFARGAQGSPILSPLDDTMWDLVLDGLGGALGGVLGSLYMRRSRRSCCRAAAFAELMSRADPPEEHDGAQPVDVMP